MSNSEQNNNSDWKEREIGAPGKELESKYLEEKESRGEEFGVAT